MLRLTCFMFAVGVLLTSCVGPTHLVPISEPTQHENLQRTVAVWRGTHISKAIQKWGSPIEVSDDGAGWQTYIWEIPIRGFFAGQEADIPGFQFRQKRRLSLLHRPSGLKSVGGSHFSTGHTYQLTFYTRPNGIISKTGLKRIYDPALRERKRSSLK